MNEAQTTNKSRVASNKRTHLYTALLNISFNDTWTGWVAIAVWFTQGRIYMNVCVLYSLFDPAPCTHETRPSLVERGSPSKELWRSSGTIDRLAVSFTSARNILCVTLYSTATGYLFQLLHLISFFNLGPVCVILYPPLWLTRYVLN